MVEDRYARDNGFGGGLATRVRKPFRRALEFLDGYPYFVQQRQKQCMWGIGKFRSCWKATDV